jgi:hypothetical protein
MEHQTEGPSPRRPDTAEESASDAAEDSADFGAGKAGSGVLPGHTGERRSATGESRVDRALAPLDELEGLPVTEHRAVFEDVHRRLSDVLGELDAGQPREAGHAGGAAGRPGR